MLHRRQTVHQINVVEVILVQSDPLQTKKTETMKTILQMVDQQSSMVVGEEGTEMPVRAKVRKVTVERKSLQLQRELELWLRLGNAR
jgi:type IV secretory pathway ATPase VirB11/archaellum biosynthesis ATPase